MSENKDLSKKTKLIIYISCVIVAIAAAIGATLLVIHFCEKEVPTYSYMSTSTVTASQPEYDIVEIVEPNDEESSDEQTSSESSKPEETASSEEKTNEKDNQSKEETSSPEDVTVDTSALVKHKVKIPVNYLSQNPELPTGCEITALTTVLNYLGYDVSKVTLSDDFLEKSDTIANFFEVYVGNPKSNGFGCFAQPIVDAANKYLKTQNSDYKAVNLSGAKFEELLTKVQNGTPVIIWSTMYSKKSQDLVEPYVYNKWVIDGETVTWLANEHCMVLIGYDTERGVAIMSDPQRGIVEYSLETVKARYISMHSQCVILQLPDVAPVVNGVDDGECYYTTQYVTVDDENLSSVKVNGKKSKNKFYINGNSEATYKIVATDTANHETTVTVHTKPISAISEAIADLTESNITADNRETVNNVRNTALDTSTDYATDKEKSALDLIITNCDAMLDKILSVTNEYNRIITAVSDYEDEIPQAEDKDIITSIVADIDALTATSNITEEQRATLVTLKTKCEELLAQIPPSEEEPTDDETDDTALDETTDDSQNGENVQGTEPDENQDITPDENQATPEDATQDIIP